MLTMGEWVSVHGTLCTGSAAKTLEAMACPELQTCTGRLAAANIYFSVPAFVVLFRESLEVRMQGVVFIAAIYPACAAYKGRCCFSRYKLSKQGLKDRGRNFQSGEKL